MRRDVVVGQLLSPEIVVIRVFTHARLRIIERYRPIIRKKKRNINTKKKKKKWFFGQGSYRV